MLYLIPFFTVLVIFISYYLLKKKTINKKPHIHILVTGPKNSGKTRLINHFLGLNQQTVPTLIVYTVETNQYKFTEDRNIKEKYDLIIHMFRDSIDETTVDKNTIFCSFLTKPNNFPYKGKFIFLDGKYDQIDKEISRTQKIK